MPFVSLKFGFTAIRKAINNGIDTQLIIGEACQKAQSY